MEVISSIFSESFWYVAPILAALTTTLSGLLNQGLGKLWTIPGWAKQLISWVLGIGVTLAAWGVKFVTFGNPVWLGIIALSVVVGLSSNGIYDIPFIRSWVDSWFKGKKVEE